jgi:spermidine synthase
VNLRLIIFALFFLSGALGLLYEITWMRQFRIIMGNTVHTSATVLTAFMGGLALGSYLAGRIVDRVRRPLRAYGILELLVGGYALILPWLMLPADPLYGWLYRSFAESTGVVALGRFVITSILLLPPATMMGATLPLLTRYLAEGLQWVGRDVGRLYGINTIGAALGAAAAGFAFVPIGGVQASLWCGAAGSILIGLLSLALDRRQPGARQVPASRTASAEAEEVAEHPLRHVVLVGLAVAGAASMVYQVAWTRTLTQLIGSSVYAFTVMLVAFIAGLGLGAVVLSGFIDRRRDPLLFLGILQVIVAAACVAIVPLFGIAPPLVVELVTSWAGSFGALHAAQFVTVFLLMLVPTFAMGGVFPTVARIYARDLSGIGRSVGEAYAANTTGSVVGSFVAGFVLIPWLGVRESILLATALNALLGCLFWWTSDWRTPRWRGAGVGAVGLATVAALVALPGWDTHLLNSAPYLYAYRYKANSVTQGTDLDRVMTGSRKLLYEEEGLTATVTVVESGDQLYLKVNGKTDASSKGDLRSQSLLSHLPALLHDDPRRALLIGLGSGISLGALAHHPVEHIDCVEISPEVVHGARLFREANGDALADDRVRLIIGDGRNHTAHVQGRFDLIISQPSNLWIAGMADLFTVEFFEASRAKLAEGGIMCTWVQAYSMTTRDFRTIVNTFAHVFPHVSLWESVPGGDYFLVGSEEPIDAGYPAMQQRVEQRALAGDLNRIGVRRLEQILSTYVTDTDGVRRFAAGAPLNTDDNATLEFSAPHGLAQGLVGGSGLFGPDDLDAVRAASPAAFVEGAMPADLDVAWRARSLARQAQVRMNEGALPAALRSMQEAARIEPEDMEVRRLYPELAATVGSDLERSGQAARAAQLYEAALQVVPDDAQLQLRHGRLLRRGGYLDAAAAAFERALAVAPGFVSARLELAGLEAQRGNPMGADGHYRQALEMEPENPEVLNEWGKQHLRQRRWDEAIGAFRQGLDLDPGQAQLANNLGVAWTQKGEISRARDWFARAVEVQPGYARAWVNLGDAARALGEAEEARSSYREALRLEPRNPRALLGLQSL